MQIAVYIAMIVNEFSHCLSTFLRKKEMTFEAYVMAVARGQIRCDGSILLAITGIWNVSITIISLTYTTEWKVHHNFVDLDVVSNGHGFGFPNEAMHYSSMVSMLKNAKLVRYDADFNVKIIKGNKGNNEKLQTLRHCGDPEKSLCCKQKTKILIEGKGL